MEFNHKFDANWSNQGSKPSSKLQTDGFQGGYKPPAGFFNWFWHKTINAINEIQSKMPDVFDNVTSSSKIAALSANQGRILNNTLKTATDTLATKTGKIMQGKTVEPKQGTTVTAGNYSEITNDYRERTFDGGGQPYTGNVASGVFSLAVNRATTASGEQSFASGAYTRASGNYSAAFGAHTVASSYHAIATGLRTRANSSSAFSMGTDSVADGQNSLAGGNASYTSGKNAFAHGNETDATGENSFATGNGTTASGSAAFAEGSNTIASGSSSHAGGSQSEAKGASSFVHGISAVAKGWLGTAFGHWTIANAYQAAFGKFNKDYAGANPGAQSAAETLFVVGNGIADDNRSNAFRVTGNGTVSGLREFNSSGADFAEYYEWLDGNLDNEDRRGRFVTLDGDKIRFANADDFIVGVVTSMGAFIGNSASENWNGRYLKDIYGEYLTQEVTVPEQIDEATGETIPAYKGTQWVVNPEYNPDLEYVSREFRKEWSPIGMLGQVVVVDDGTCQVNGYCKPSVDGIGTAADNGYRVMSRIDDTHIKVLVK